MARRALRLLGLLALAVATMGCDPVPGPTDPPAKAKRLVLAGGESGRSDLDVLCDVATGHLIYLMHDHHGMALAVVPGGCRP